METEVTEASVRDESGQQSSRWEKLGKLADLGKRKLVPLTTVGLLGGLALFNACGGAEGEVPEATTEPLVLPPTAGAPIALSTAEIPRVVPDETAKATATAKPTLEVPTPPPAVQTTEAPPSATPSAEATQEVVQPKNYTIEIMPPDETKSSLEAWEKYTVEETKQMIDSLATKIPILGKVRFLVALGGGMGFAGQDQEGKLVIEVDRTDPELESDLPHEVVQSWDFVIKKEANEQLLGLREQVLSDPQIGRNYPDDLERIFGDYTRGRRKFLDTNDVFSLEEFKVLTSGEANGFWISSLSFFKEFLSDESLMGKVIAIKDNDPSYPNRLTYSSLADFLEKEVQALNDSAQRNNRRKVVLEEITGNSREFEPYLIRLVPELEDDKQTAYWWQAYEELSWVIMAKKYLRGESGVPELFSADERGRIDKGLNDAREAADAEQLAEVVSKSVILNEQGRLTFEIPQVDSFIQGIRNLSGN